jgi:glyoxylase-like metal-dependent hydrolase (beta-lactamase superfamily II)
MHPEQITPHVWRFASRIYQYNAGLVAVDGHAWLIDPGVTLEETRSIQQFCEDHSLTIEVVMLTHFHYDHILGANAFDEAVVVTNRFFEHEFTSMRQVSEGKIKRMAIEEKMQIPDWSLDIHTDWTINRQQTFLVGDLDVTLISLPGHTKDQMGLFIPSEKFLWAADTLSDLEIPFMSNSPAKYQKSLEKVARMDLDIIVPGHGNPTKSKAEVLARVGQDISYIRELRKRVRDGIRRNLQLAEIQHQCAAMVFPNKEDNLTPHQWNVEAAYLEEGGKNFSGSIGWNKEWVFDEKS